MESFFWHLANRTAETQFIFNLFHLLLAGLTLLVLLHQLRASREAAHPAPDRLLPLGFLLLVLHFALLTLYFGAAFFLHKEWGWAGFEPIAHALLAWGLLVVVAAYLKAEGDVHARLARWPLRGCGVVAGAVVFDLLLSFPLWASGERSHSAAMFLIDLLTFLAVGLGIQALLRGEREGKRASLAALFAVGAALFLHAAPVFLPRPAAILVWNAEQHMLSVALFAFAWATGERSRNLLDRVFVRLNLTLIVLASLIMLITAGMEKYQYLHLAEERSMNLAEFLRGHIVYYRVRGENLESIFKHPEVLRRVVVEFGTLPELREVRVYLDGQRASFHYTQDWEIREEIAPLSAIAGADPAEGLANSFQMIHLPIEAGRDSGSRIEFWGTMDYINEYIGKYIILIYFLFTIMVGLATGIIGIIVRDTDRRLRRQYAQLQDTHQQLAQAAKLASVGQLAGGMAHEINNPITSILSLASHMGEDKGAGTLTARQRHSLQVIAQQAQRVSKIVGNLLTFSRQTRLELSRVEVPELIDTAVTLVQYRLRERRIRLRREIDSRLPVVLGDAGRLTEVIVNLLNNAIDAMPAGGTLTLRASRNPNAKGGVRVEVKDTGGGIPPEQLSRIFDPFFTTKEPGRGTGLGLSISHGIVKDHGGQIWAESQPSAGTTLVVTLPKEGS
ncbi:MAG: sensor histidine kinase [Terriglobia bacterium]